MEQMALFDATPRWTVTTLTRHLRQLLESDASLQAVWVQGEISNLARPASGHIYFTLKDSNSSLKCVVWRSDAARLRLALQDGLAVDVHGSISLYEAGGQYQLYADTLRPLGEGALHGSNVVCPWHAWEWDCRTGAYDYDPSKKVATYPVRIEGEDILIEIP